MISKTVPTYAVRIFSSGPIEVAKQALRLRCLQKGLCVTIEPTTFIYTGGEEQGFVVGLVNYPRFPSTNEALWNTAREVALLLLEACAQHSVLLQAPDITEWVTKRE
jgi:hypothetical protein